MSRFDFDTPINRRTVPALKTHPMVLGPDSADLFAAGVADMDFPVAPVIQDALAERLAHGVFGYEALPDALIPALQNWHLTRHGWTIAHNHILRAPNALNTLALAATLFSDPGDAVIVQPPVFFDFFDVVQENGRRVVENPLNFDGQGYQMDFPALEALAADPRSKLLFLCNPHNPVGRAWSRDELETLHTICARNGVLVVSDELHIDLTLPGHTATPFASLSPEAAQNSITILSPAKTFNIASCCSAFTVIANDTRRVAFQTELSRLTANKNNAFANAAMCAAYSKGAPWVTAVMDYIAGNLALLRDALAEIPRVRVIEPEATFLIWLDFRDLNLNPTELQDFLRNTAKIAMTRGVAFGTGGAGFMRLNIATNRSALKIALERLKAEIALLPS